MTIEEALTQLRLGPGINEDVTEDYNDATDMAIEALEAWNKFKQALDKRILEQGFDEDEWSISYNELIKMMKKCGGVQWTEKKG